MPDIAIFVSSVSRSGTDLYVNGIAHTSDTDDTFGWGVSVAFDALAATINAAIRDAAVTVAGAAGHTVGALDQKRLFGGVMGI